MKYDKLGVFSIKHGCYVICNYYGCVYSVKFCTVNCPCLLLAIYKHVNTKATVR